MDCAMHCSKAGNVSCVNRSNKLQLSTGHFATVGPLSVENLFIYVTHSSTFNIAPNVYEKKQT